MDELCNLLFCKISLLLVEGFGNFHLFESKNLSHILESSGRNRTMEKSINLEVNFLI